METSQNTLQSYVQSLLTLMGEDGSKPLGMALRWDTQTSKYNLPADRVLQAMVKHALSPQTVAQQFMTELGKCKIAAVISLGARAISIYAIHFTLIIMCKSKLYGVITPLVRVNGRQRCGKKSNRMMET